MTTEELEQLTHSAIVKSLAFDGFEFEIEFDNGVTVIVGITIAWDSAV